MNQNQSFDALHFPIAGVCTPERQEEHFIWDIQYGLIVG